VAKHKQPDFNGVANSGTAQISNLQQGDVCRALVLKLGGTTFDYSHIENIKVKLGSKTIVDLSGTQLKLINAYMGRTYNAAYLPIHFADPNSRTIDGENWGAIDTSIPYGSFSIQVKITGATAPTLECWMDKADANPDVPDREVFRAYVSGFQSIPAAGRPTLAVPVGSIIGNLITRAHFFHAEISKLDVKRDGYNLIEEGEVALLQFEQAELNRVIQAGHLCFDPLISNDQSMSISTTMTKGGVKMPAPLEFRAVLDDADTVNMITELYTTVERI